MVRYQNIYITKGLLEVALSKCLVETNVLMQSYPPRVLDRRLQEDWARDVGEGYRVLMSLRVDFGPMG